MAQESRGNHNLTQDLDTKMNRSDIGAPAHLFQPHLFVPFLRIRPVGFERVMGNGVNGLSVYNPGADLTELAGQEADTGFRCPVMDNHLASGYTNSSGMGMKQPSCSVVRPGTSALPLSGLQRFHRCRRS